MLSQQRADSLGVSTADPSAVFVTKSLLNPVIAVLTLIVCLQLWGEPLHGPYFLLAVLAFLGAADFLNMAQLSSLRNWRKSLGDLLYTACRWTLLVGAIWALLHLSGFADSFDQHVLIVWALVTPITIWGGQLAAHYLLRRPSDQLRKAVIVGVTDLGLRLERSLQAEPLLRTEIVGYFEDRSLDRIPQEKIPQVLGKSATLADYVLKRDINVVYVTLPMNRDPRVLAMLEQLRDSTVSIYFVPDLFVFSLVQARIDFVSGIPLVAVCESPFFGIRGVLKRLTDVLVAGAAALLLAPVLIGVAIAVRMDSPGPIVFRQRRYGLDGKSIIVYKFRTMTVTEDGESTYTQVSRNDVRVTKLGSFLRKASLDELPQLFNVLEGSMSIVGPRPHAIAVNEQYRRQIPGYMVRHKVKPGITGWAQVNGYRGGDDLSAMTKRIELDLEYLRHWSLWLDLVILLRTTLMVLTDKRAY